MVRFLARQSSWDDIGLWTTLLLSDLCTCKHCYIFSQHTHMHIQDTTTHNLILVRQTKIKTLVCPYSHFKGKKSHLPESTMLTKNIAFHKRKPYTCTKAKNTVKPTCVTVEIHLPEVIGFAPWSSQSFRSMGDIFVQRTSNSQTLDSTSHYSYQVLD